MGQPGLDTPAGEDGHVAYIQNSLRTDCTLPRMKHLNSRQKKTLHQYFQYLGIPLYVT